MTNIAIRCEGLSKKYRIRHQYERQRYVALRDVFADKFFAPWRWLVEQRAKSNGQSVNLQSAIRNPQSVEDFWALKDVFFEIKHGEVVGIIGRNGAGKSTLLKILSRITEPTKGHVQIHGRIGSLLEVGTGFHPELTGRENIYLNGAILGMKRAEIERKFDEIVAFAEIEKFLDTPVKHYSSGMYVRLAFAVAAHLEPEILLVDEVLAVGDAQFQKKCLGKMGDVAREGRTVLFVSHQMAAVQNLCQTGLLLSKGSLIGEGNISSVLQSYLYELQQKTKIELNKRADRSGSGSVRFVSVSLQDESGQFLNALTCGAPAIFVLRFINYDNRDLRNFHVSVGIDNEVGQRVLLLDTAIAQDDFAWVPEDAQALSIEIPKLTLLPGRYSFTLFSTVGGIIADWVHSAGTFDVESGDFFGTGRLPPMGQGSFVSEHKFRLQEASGSSSVYPLE